MTLDMASGMVISIEYASALLTADTRSAMYTPALECSLEPRSEVRFRALLRHGLSNVALEFPTLAHSRKQASTARSRDLPTPLTTRYRQYHWYSSLVSDQPYCLPVERCHQLR